MARVDRAVDIVAIGGYPPSVGLTKFWRFRLARMIPFAGSRHKEFTLCLKAIYQVSGLILRVALDAEGGARDLAGNSVLLSVNAQAADSPTVWRAFCPPGPINYDEGELTKLSLPEDDDHRTLNTGVPGPHNPRIRSSGAESSYYPLLWRRTYRSEKSFLLFRKSFSLCSLLKASRTWRPKCLNSESSTAAVVSMIIVRRSIQSRNLRVVSDLDIAVCRSLRQEESSSSMLWMMPLQPSKYSTEMTSEGKRSSLTFHEESSANPFLVETRN